MNIDLNYKSLPITMKQFEDLTNRVIVDLNALKNEESGMFEGNYVAQVVMATIHAMKHEQGYYYYDALLEGVVNRISCHVTYHAIQEIQAKIKAEATASGNPPTLQVVPDESNQA